MKMELENNAQFIRRQEDATSPRTVERYHLFIYYNGAITDLPAANAVKVRGNATSQIVVGDKVIISTESFTTTFTITGSAYADGKTQITFDQNLAAATYGGYVAQYHDVTPKILAPPTVEAEIEGDTLNAFDAGSLTLEFDNSEKEFWDEQTRTGYLYHFSFASTISQIVATASCVAQLMLNGMIDETFPDEQFTGYFLLVLTGVDEGEEYPIIASGSTTVSIYGDHALVVGDEIVIDVSKDVDVKILTGFAGIYA